MARAGNGSNATLTASVAPLDGSDGPWCIAFWFRALSNAQSNTYLFSSTDAGGGNQVSVIYEYVNDTVELYAAAHSGTDPRTNSGLTVSDTNWHHIAYRKDASGTANYDKFLDGTKTNISGSMSTTFSTALDRMAVLSSGSADYTNSEIADLAIWDGSAPSDADIASMADGLCALMVKKPTWHWDLFGKSSPEISRIRSDASLTVTNATAAAHPRIIYPRRAVTRKYTTATAGASTIGLLRANAGLNYGPFSLANAGVGAIA